MAAAHHGEPDERDDDRADDTDDEEWGLGGGDRCRLVVLLWCEWVVGDAEGFALLKVGG